MVSDVIAVLDDDRSVCRALVGLVRSLGHDARGYYSAEDFIASARRDETACMITDIQLARMSGIDLVRYNISRGAYIPVIFITARDDPQIEDRARSLDPIGFLRKPIEPGKLGECLDKALGR